jgi:hypothetical protein
MYDMPTITVRISEVEKKRLLKHGTLSATVREALEFYLDAKKSQELMGKLERLQHRNAVRTTSAEEVRLISEDRKR